MTPSRRQILELALLAGAGASFAELPSRAAPAPGSVALDGYADTVRALRHEFRARAAAWVKDGRLARPDGFVYAVDVAQLMACAADAGDRAGYAALRALAADHLVVDDPSDALTRGFVAWRFKPTESHATPDASGTTEALRLVRALWRGAAAFDATADRDLALAVLRGYARHQAVDGGVWLVRNYFSFATRGFATNSFLIDYDPDLVALVATEAPDEALAELARKSVELVRGAATPAGLLYDLVQPELRTMYPLLPEAVITFSPNDVVQLSNAAAVALTVTTGAPDVTRRVLNFAAERLAPGSARPLCMYHYGRTGEAVNDTPPAINEWGGLLRLACALGDRAAAGTLLDKAVAAWDYYLDHTPADQPDAFVASEALAAISAVLSLA